MDCGPPGGTKSRSRLLNIGAAEWREEVEEVVGGECHLGTWGPWGDCVGGNHTRVVSTVTPGGLEVKEETLKCQPACTSYNILSLIHI